MSFDDERSAIEGRFAGAYSSTDVKYENVPFEQPTDTAWVALTILSGAGNQVSIGSSRPVKRFSGIIQLDIYTPELKGTKEARDLADAISVIFDSVQFEVGSSGVISTLVPEFTTLGIQGGWYHAVVSVTYQRDKIG